MRKLLISSTLAACLLLLAPTANAALTPVNGSMSISASAQVGSDYGDNASDSATTGNIWVMASSMDSDDMMMGGMGGAMANAMSDASITVRDNGFAVSGNGNAGINDGPGHAENRVYLNFAFSLDQQSSCAITADNYWEKTYGTETATASIYLADSTGQKLLELTNPLTSSYAVTLVLDAGQYSVVGNVYCVSDAPNSYMGVMWNGTGMFGMDLTATEVVPEPFTLSLLGFGGLLALRKRK